jgi:hypothetical protein
MKSRIRRIAAFATVPFLAASLALGAAASAQSPSASPAACALLQVEEVAAAFEAEDVQLNGGSTYYCLFQGAVSLYLALQPGSLDPIRTQYPEGTEITVADHPAWFASDASTLFVESDGQVLSLASYGDLSGADLQAALTTLAEAALPRVPPGPSPEDVAHVREHMPETLDGEALNVQLFTGQMLLSFLDPTAPAIVALQEALAAQGIGIEDIIVAAGNTTSGSDAGVLIVQFKGAEAAPMLEPFVLAFVPGADTASVTTEEIGGKQVTTVSAEQVIHGYANGDLAFYANGPDEALAAFFAGLP